MLSICCVLAERLKKFQVGRFLLGWLGWLSFKFLLGWQSFKVPSWLAKLQSSYLVWQSFKVPTWLAKASLGSYLVGKAFPLVASLGWQSFTWYSLVGKASLGSYLAKLHLGWQWQWDQLWLSARRTGLSCSQARPRKKNSPKLSWQAQKCLVFEMSSTNLSSLCMGSAKSPFLLWGRWARWGYPSSCRCHHPSGLDWGYAKEVDQESRGEVTLHGDQIFSPTPKPQSRLQRDLLLVMVFWGGMKRKSRSSNMFWGWAVGGKFFFWGGAGHLSSAFSCLRYSPEVFNDVFVRDFRPFFRVADLHWGQNWQCHFPPLVCTFSNPQNQQHFRLCERSAILYPPFATPKFGSPLDGVSSCALQLPYQNYTSQFVSEQLLRGQRALDPDTLRHWRLRWMEWTAFSPPKKNHQIPDLARASAQNKKAHQIPDLARGSAQTKKRPPDPRLKASNQTTK